MLLSVEASPFASVEPSQMTSCLSIVHLRALITSNNDGLLEIFFSKFFLRKDAAGREKREGKGGFWI